MRIVHIAPNAPYNDNWGYQENLLPKYQAKLGHDVTIIVTNTQHADGKIIATNEEDYYLADGVRVIRRKYKQYPHRILTSLARYIPVYELLKELEPDFIFFHGLASTSIFDAIKYKKKDNPHCVIVQDNHLDYYNSKTDSVFKDVKIRSFYRYITKRTISEIARVYGVTPWRKQFAEECLKVPKEKTDILIMGADDEKVNLLHRNETRDRIRRDYCISSEDFLIVTGGKIDEAKNTHLLMEAVREIENVKLLVFGSISEKMLDRVKALQSRNIQLIGWIPSDMAYEYFMAADLVCFPGTHSVMWEQACACKVPCVFARWEGMDHVDNGGNARFIDDLSADGIKDCITRLLKTPEYYEMLKCADSDKTDIYLYSNIARKSLECADGVRNAK